MPTISVIMPALNEDKSIESALTPLQVLRSLGHEIILVDAGSTDATVKLATPLVDKIIVSSKGRAIQMNTGAENAKGELLWFLHADTVASTDAINKLIGEQGLSELFWGRFNVKLSGINPLFRVIEFMMNWRSRVTRIATGDQGIFIYRDLFQKIGGFPKIALMEDIEICRILKKKSKPHCFAERVISSSRRWEQRGILRTVLLMWLLRLLNLAGVHPDKLARLYY